MTHFAYINLINDSQNNYTGKSDSYPLKRVFALLFPSMHQTLHVNCARIFSHVFPIKTWCVLRNVVSKYSNELVCVPVFRAVVHPE